MSFYCAEESCFLDAVASSTSPIVEIVPLTNIDMFQYLDSNPEALHRYFEERKGLLRSFTKTNTDSQCLLCGLSPQKLSYYKPIVIAESEAASGETGRGEYFLESEMDPSQTFDNLWSPTFMDFPISPHSLFSPPPSPSTSSHGSKSVPPSSMGLPPVPSSPSSASASASSPAPQRKRAAAASRQTNSRKWSAEEEESCIKHMKAVVEEREVQGEARFGEAGRRMKEIDGFERTKATAIKNFWNRIGRARSGIDERKNRSAPLATSLQGKSSKPSASKSSQTKGKTSTAAKSRVFKHESDSDSDAADKQNLLSPTTTLTPPKTARKRPRRSIPDSDSESEEEPNQATQKPDEEDWDQIETC